MTTRETAPQTGEHRLAREPEPYPGAHGQTDAGLDAGTGGRRAGLQEPTAYVADPGPLGLAAFAATTFLLSLFNAAIVKNEALETVVLPLALFYGGLAQLLAGMWEFKKANTFGATAFASFGAFWLSFAAYVKFVKPGLPAADAHTATGLFLLVFAIFTTYMFVASLRVSGAVALVFVTLAATFWVLAIGNLNDTKDIIKIGGYLGLVTAVCAWYASFAAVTNDTWKRTVLPTMPAKHH
jgi:succinate-acetate transporter protein